MKTKYINLQEHEKNSFKDHHLLHFTNTTSSKQVSCIIFISGFISCPRRKGHSSVKLTRKVLTLKNKKLAFECVTLLASLSFSPYFKNMESNPGLQKKTSGITLHFKRNEMFELTSHAILEIIHDLP